MLLSGLFAVFGSNDLYPFLINLIPASLIILLVYRILKMYCLGSFPTLLGLLSLAFITPLPTMVFTGMEHVLQIAISLVFAFAVAGKGSNQKSSTRSILMLSVLAASVTLIRYEGMFMISMAVLLLILRRRWRAAVAVAIFGAMPIVIYGLISLSQGWHFFPNSILIKSSPPSLGDWRGIINTLGYGGLKCLMSATDLFALVVLTVVVLIMRNPEKTESVEKPFINLAAIFLGTTLRHVQLKRPGWLYRYEAYLISIGLVLGTILSWMIQQFGYGCCLL